MGKYLKFTEKDILSLEKATYFHDIGKIFFYDKQLSDSFDLSLQGHYDLKKHPVIGYRILDSFETMAGIAESVLSHHENWDGSVFPNSLKGRKVPLYARIIAVADSYYRNISSGDSNKAKRKKDALNFLRSNARVLFDPVLVELFLQLIEKGSPSKKRLLSEEV